MVTVVVAPLAAVLVVVAVLAVVSVPLPDAVFVADDVSALAVWVLAVSRPVAVERDATVVLELVWEPAPQAPTPRPDRKRAAPSAARLFSLVPSAEC